MKSILSFDYYDVLETVYKHNPIFEESNGEEMSITPSFNLNIKYKDKKRTEATLLFTTELGDEGLQKYPFYIKACILGVFSLEIKDQEDENTIINNMYKKNAVAILYPYMRSLVSDLSSKGNEMPLILPPINVGAMIENEELITEEYSE